MNKELTIIMVSGHAMVGKDTFYELLNKISPRFKRYAFADRLKQDLRLFIMEQCKIDVLHLTAEQKKLVRPLLIAYGCMMRNIGDGLHWVRELEKQMLSDLEFENNLGGKQTIPVISDGRFENEIIYFKSRYNVIVVEVKRNEAPDPPEEEKINQPLVGRHASHTIEWPTVGPENVSILHDFAEDFIKKFNLI